MTVELTREQFAALAWCATNGQPSDPAEALVVRAAIAELQRQLAETE